MLVRLVTCRTLPEPDPDQEPLLAALRAAGLEARLAVWDDPEETWKGGLSVIRSTWDYHLRYEAFLEWVERASRRSRLLNPPGAVRFSSHKRYLGDLEAAGFPVVPTVQLRRGEAAKLADIMAARGWDDVVVKPAVSLASFETARVRGDLAAGEAHLARLLLERDAMVQPYLASVEGYGERSIVWIDGAVTHAVRKSPRFGGEHEAVSRALEPAADERALAEAFVRHVGEELLYARVDLARDAEGHPMLMELELIEPSLFLLQRPRALERLVRAIAARDVEIVEALGAARIEDARSLFREYQRSLEVDLCFQGFEKELAALPGSYSRPRGRLYVAARGGELLGCVALRALDGTTCEMKRLYVRPGARGLGLGRRLAGLVVSEARKEGYERMRLDTLPSMKEAIALYRALGFVEIAPYCANPVAGAIFMELRLGA